MNSYSDFIGLVLPPVIDIINSKLTNTKLKFLVSLTLCLAVSAVANFTQLKSGDIAEVLSSTALIFTEAQFIYKTYWNESKARGALFNK